MHSVLLAIVRAVELKKPKFDGVVSVEEAVQVANSIS